MFSPATATAPQPLDTAKRRRRPDTGTVRPYRPAPPDFREVYLRNGWIGPEGSIEEIFRANYRCIARWIEECGGDELRAARSAITGTAPRPNKRSKRYCQGKTLTARPIFAAGQS